MDERILRRWWRAPIWILALASGAKSFVDNPILGSERLNRRGLHVGRLKLAHRLAWSRRRRLASSVPKKWRDQFDKNGFVEIRDFLPADKFAQLQEHLFARKFECREHQQGSAVTRRVAIDPTLLETVPHLRDLLGDRSWRALLAYVASTRSKPLCYLQTIISGHMCDSPDPQLDLHADTFHPSLKAWLFLTDVSNDQAPLSYVRGSHRLTPERLAWEKERSIGIRKLDRLSQRGSLRIGEHELAALGLPRPTRFAVPANTLVVVDTFGFHARGSCTQPTVRSEIWAFARRTPFVPWTGLDLLSWSPLASRRASWLAAIVDRLERFGLMKQHWARADRKRLIDP